MRYHLFLVLSFFVFVAHVNAQEISLSVAAFERAFPELQLLTKVTTLTPNDKPMLLGLAVGYWYSSDNPNCLDCTLFNRNFVRTGIRLSQSISKLPFRTSLGVGIRHQIQFLEVTGVGPYGTAGDYTKNNIWPEVFFRTNVRLIQNMLLETTVVRGSNFTEGSPVKEYLDVRIGLAYSM